MDTDDKNSLAFKHFQEGNLEQTEKDCLGILHLDPDNNEILHLLGITYYHLGANDRAVEYLKKALQQDPENADYFYDLGSVYQHQGLLDESTEAYQKALTIDPEHIDCHNNLGMVLHDQGRLDEALVHYQKALELSPQDAHIHNNLGLLYQEQEEYTKAIAHYGRAIQFAPQYADVYYNMGHIFMKEQNPNQAFMYFRKAAELNPGLEEAYISMAYILLQSRKFAEAIPSLQRLLAANPDSAEIHNNLGNALGEIWQLDQAVVYLQRAVQLNPNFAEAWNNLGNTLGKIGRLDEAADCLNKALQLDPGLADALVNLGTVFKEKGRFGEAASFFQKALLLLPDNAEARLNVALIDLMHGSFQSGWEGYEFRRQVKGAHDCTFPQPMWDGSPLSGRTIFICAELGLGDEIMFASCLSEIAEQAELSIIECDDRLVRLFERSFAGSKVIRRVEGDRYPSDLPPADFQIPIGSLPRLLRPDVSTYPHRKSYLLPDAEKVDVWKKRYAELGDGLKVGVSWRGGGTPDMVRVRSTTLDQWSELLRIPGIQFVSLQYGDCAKELSDAMERLGVKIYDWTEGDPLTDLDTFAAKIAALDLVISVDNATVHTAGALGANVWILLPHVCDWRWMINYEDTLWYDSARLFRQGSPGEWDGVFKQVSRRLAEVLRQKPYSPDVFVFPVEKSCKSTG